VFQIPRHTGTTEKNNAEVSVIKYLNDPPSVDELKKILALVGITPRELLRQKDAEKAGINDPGLSDYTLLAIMVTNPAAIEWPIVISRKKQKSAGRQKQFLTYCRIKFPQYL
jgi:arsenate reductase (glutaredoxin)|tara:strand:+ start:21 stop:356 length:336 start_codon:yes stop_codon:yes gene_type:complete